MSNRDTIQADGAWRFDEEVTTVFDDMLARSIPQYEVMRRGVTDVALSFARSGTDIVDLGASRGEAIAPLVDQLGAACRYTCVEVSPPMLSVLRSRFAAHPYVNVLDLDLRRAYPEAISASVTLAVLTVQFTPIEYRQRILRTVYEHTRPGGALILVEKALGATADLDSLMVGRYYDLKGAHGYSAEQIERKRLSLEGVLVPVTAKWNEDLLRGAGFGEVDCFWRWMNFAAWVAVK